jgi:hypothetical protein
MKVLFASLVAITALTSSAFGQQDAPKMPQANDNPSCIELDKEIGALAAPTLGSPDTYIDGFLRSYFDVNSDDDVAGFRFEQLRIHINGKIEHMKWRVSWELSGGTAKLKDAWVKWKLTDSMAMTWGQFKRPNLYAFKVCGGFRLLIKPTMNVSNQKREQGAMLNFKFPKAHVHGALAVFNGTDGTDDDLSLIGRLAYDFIGKGAYRKHEGAVDAPEEMAGSAALVYGDDGDSVTGGSYAAFDSVVTGKKMYFHAELMDYDSDFNGVDKITGKALADTTTMAFTASYMVADDKEIAVRYEDWDDTDSTSRVSVGFNLYSVLPHKVKWSINYSDLTSDDAAVEAQVISAGLTINL